MADSERAVESSGADVELAIEVGLEQLGVNRAAVEVEVLDEGTRGVFGLGAKEARVRLILKEEDLAVSADEEVLESRAAAEDQDVAILGEETGAAVSEDPEGALGRDTLLELVSLMGMPDMQVDVRRPEPEPGEGKPPLILDLHGPGAENLIGRRAETLAALQRIARLIVGRDLTGPARFVVDIDGFKEHRKEVLYGLARRLAKQAVETDRTVVLEPMPPQERRIVHLALRDEPGVTTQSIGEGDRRKVTIIPQG